LLVKRILFLLNAAFATAIFDLISRVHLLWFTMLPKQLKYYTFFNCFWSTIVCNGDGSVQILITLLFSHSFLFHKTSKFQSAPLTRWSADNDSGGSLPQKGWSLLLWMFRKQHV
jgi:hypothetical protein